MSDKPRVLLGRIWTFCRKKTSPTKRKMRRSAPRWELSLAETARH